MLCTIAVCGDGIVEAGVEACDDGNQIDDDDCPNNCAPPVCGDGIVQDEACDDGNNIDTDGCLTTCLVAAWRRLRTCGVESCDDGNDDNSDGCLDTAQLRAVVMVFNGQGSKGVTTETTMIRMRVWSCIVAACGDGVVQDGVECDDGNNVNGTAAETTAGWRAAVMALFRTGKACDDGNDDNTDGCLNTVRSGLWRRFRSNRRRSVR